MFNQGRRARWAFSIFSCGMLSILSACVLPPVGPSCRATVSGPPVVVDMDKWSSGMYADAYAGHNVEVDGYFVASYTASLSQGSSQISFAIVKYNPADYPNNPQRAQETMMRPGAVGAQAPISMRDQIFALKPYQPVRVYGVASLIGIYPAITPTVQSASTLVLCVNSIQPR